MTPLWILDFPNNLTRIRRHFG